METKQGCVLSTLDDTISLADDWLAGRRVLVTISMDGPVQPTWQVHGSEHSLCRGVSSTLDGYRGRDDGGKGGCSPPACTYVVMHFRRNYLLSL